MTYLKCPIHNYTQRGRFQFYDLQNYARIKNSTGFNFSPAIFVDIASV